MHTVQLHQMFSSVQVGHKPLEGSAKERERIKMLLPTDRKMMVCLTEASLSALGTHTVLSAAFSINGHKLHQRKHIINTL